LDGFTRGRCSLDPDWIQLNLDPAKYLDPNSAKYLDPDSAKYLDPDSAKYLDPDSAKYPDPDSVNTYGTPTLGKPVPTCE
jgi:hypothetical protein